MLNALGLIARRAARKPIPLSALVEYSAGMVANPPVSEVWQGVYEKIIASHGQSLSTIWRDEFQKTLSDIAKEPAWTLQKRLLLWHLVKETGWTALLAVVKKDDPVDCWRGFVEDVDMFKNIPDASYYSMLMQRGLLAIVMYSVLFVTGTAPYGLGERHKQSLEIYHAHRKDYIRAVVDGWRGYYTIEGKFGAALADIYVQSAVKLEPIIQEIIAYNNMLKDRVINETMDVVVFKKELDELDRKKREALDALRREEPEGEGK